MVGSEELTYSVEVAEPLEPEEEMVEELAILVEAGQLLLRISREVRQLLGIRQTAPNSLRELVLASQLY